MVSDKSIFVWRDEFIKDIIDEEWSKYALWIEHSEKRVLESGCKFCGGPVLETEEWGEIHESSSSSLSCKLCGWIWREESTMGFNARFEKILREFNINSAELSLDELGAYLSKHYADVNSISPYLFERLIGDIFANQGYKVEMTKLSRDGGYDLLIVAKSGDTAIVEVKRWKKPLGVSLVRQLRGVQVREGIPHSILVTSSRFTGPAQSESQALRPIEEGYSLNLLDADDVLRFLKRYSNPTFSLSEIDKLREEAWKLQGKV